MNSIDNVQIIKGRDIQAGDVVYVNDVVFHIKQAHVSFCGQHVRIVYISKHGRNGSKIGSFNADQDYQVVR